MADRDSYSTDDEQPHHEENVELNTSGDVGMGNGSQLIGQTPTANSSGDHASLTDGAHFKNFQLSEVKCDDCGRAEPIRLWRWCIGCERVLCETCSVEGHFAHSIESYATAVRRADDQHRQSVEEVRAVLDKLSEGAKVAEEVQDDIVSKLEAITRDMQAKIEENKDVEATLAEHLTAMAKLKDEPLTAKTWAERNQYIIGLQSLMERAFNKQKETEECLKKIDGLVDENGRKLSEIFREDH